MLHISQSWMRKSEQFEEFDPECRSKHNSIYLSTPHLTKVNINEISEEKKDLPYSRNYDFLRIKSQKLKEEIDSLDKKNELSQDQNEIIENKAEAEKYILRAMEHEDDISQSTPGHKSNQENSTFNEEKQIEVEANESLGENKIWNEFDSLNTGEDEASEANDSISQHNLVVNPSKTNLRENEIIDYFEKNPRKITPLSKRVGKEKRIHRILVKEKIIPRHSQSSDAINIKGDNNNLNEYHYRDAYQDCKIEECKSMNEIDESNNIANKLLYQWNFEVYDIEDPERIIEEYNAFNSNKLDFVTSYFPEQYLQSTIPIQPCQDFQKPFYNPLEQQHFYERRDYEYTESEQYGKSLNLFE